MAPDERTRVDLAQVLTAQFGPDLAAYLMEVVPPFGWDEIATKTDLAALSARIDQRFDQVNERIDLKVDGLGHQLRGEFKHQINRLLMWLVPTVIAAIVAGSTLD
jgi:hypothetical protein